MFSIITIASSTTKPVAIVSAISDRLSSDMPAKAMTPKVPISDSGTATAGITVAAQAAQEDEDHRDDQADREDQRELDVLDRGTHRHRCGRRTPSG